MSSSTDKPPDGAAPAHSSTEPTTGQIPALASRVLVVDDSSLVRRAVHRLLADEGYRVQTASSGEEAFDLCLREPFDALVSDVTMEALSGFQLCRLLRSKPSTATLPIIMLTAAGDPRSRFWGRNAGADEYLAKESMRTDLLPALAKLLKGKEIRRQGASGPPSAPPDPMRRLAEVLDRHLFDAVVATEMRQLMHHLDDRDEFVRTTFELTAEIAQYAYVVVRLAGPGGPTCAVHARGPWPEEPTRAALAALGLGPEDVVSLEVKRDGPVPEDGDRISSGEMALFPIVAGGERLGEINAFGGDRRLADEDRSTLALVASELGLPTKALFLMEETRRLAQTDALTGLANRRTTTDRLTHEMQRIQRADRPLSVALGDIDHFKSVNDDFGHAVGDQVLMAVAQTLEQTVRQVDLVSRWGGEEFLLVLPEASPAGARVVAERLRDAVTRIGPVPAGPKKVTLSLGVATHVPGESCDTLINRADEALYRAKERGRNRVEVAPLKESPGPGGPPAAPDS